MTAKELYLKARTSRYKLLSVALVIVIICLLTCKGKKPPVAPVTTPVSVQKKESDKNENILRKSKDSADRIIAQLRKELKASDDKLIGFIRDYGTGEREIDSTLAQEVPDTCRELQVRLTDQFKRLKRTSESKDREFNNKISNLGRIGAEQERKLKADSVFQAKQKIALDTCWANQQRLEDYVKRTKIKRSVYAGITGIGSGKKVYEGLGINVGLENRRGTKYEIGAIQFAGSIHYTVGVKKTLFKF